MSPEPVEGRFSTQHDQSSIAGMLNLAVVAGSGETAFRQAQRSSAAQRSLIEFGLDAFEVFGGSELGVEVAPTSTELVEVRLSNFHQSMVDRWMLHWVGVVVLKRETGLRQAQPSLTRSPKSQSYCREF